MMRHGSPEVVITETIDAVTVAEAYRDYLAFLEEGTDPAIAAETTAAYFEYVLEGYGLAAAA